MILAREQDIFSDIVCIGNVLLQSDMPAPYTQSQKSQGFEV